ncbi:GNAT family N-acetyltransferase [Brevibacillus ruminantium]|uniref:GNAT family N-acetyltransferase n=1 Tax=Brevibacillus ruminantium TaxID=2950604 RepID=A0ABY4WL44_9BACL|nr:GNAT family N-acetyltransferase [Brevibacillus ruminantium]USG67888.1 GNAT family N-acetyltransferase [Brevibacillus ruminantium]
MIELSKDSFYKVMPLLKNGHPHPEVLSILENNNPGWVFSDQLDSPTTALIWSKGIRGFYLIGDHNNHVFNNELNNYITNKMKPRMKEQGLDNFEVSGHHDKWNLESLFASRQLQQWDQLVFQLTDFENKALEPSDNRMTALHLQSHEWRDRNFMNSKFVDDHIDLFWCTQDDFYKKGYGYVAIDGPEIIGVCYSSFVTQETHAIGIETLPHYQKSGVGTYLAGLLVNKIIENGFSAYWDCSLSNDASKKLALRLGFKQVHQYKCVGFAI